MPFDEEKQINLEYEGYNGEIIKQADVVLLKFPLSWNGYRGQSVLNDLQYYEEKTDEKEGPAMTYGVYAIGWIAEGKLARAEPLFAKSYANVHEPYLVWTETPNGGAVNFITGAGGFLQAVINGYGGLRILDPTADTPFRFKKAIQFNPVLPPNSDFVRFKGVSFQDSRITIEYNSTHVSVVADELSSSTAAFISHQSSISQIITNTKVTFACQVFQIFSQ